jgi:branched-chain amino acid transport system substrate-binding protein
MPYFFKEVALSSNQARELGINATLMGGDGWPSEQLISMAKDAVEGSFFVNHLDYDDPEVQDFKTNTRQVRQRCLSLTVILYMMQFSCLYML